MDIRKNSDRRLSIYLIAILGLATIGWPPVTASAQGLFDFLFGGFQQAPAPQTQSPQPLDYANLHDLPAQAPLQQLPVEAGPSVAYCVRLCDGRFFPLPHLNTATPVQQCNTLCPASRTKIFSGSEISRSVAVDGSRYAALANAFVYRTQLIPNCTCNGRDSFGLARVDIDADATLRTGDIVATDSGPKTFTGLKLKYYGAHSFKYLAN
jgi:hypothetical protein